MDIAAKSYRQGIIIVISGPVQSDKNEKIESFLDGVVDSGYKTKENIIAFRHPSDDPDPEHLGRHPVEVVYKADQIYEKITPSTRTVVIAGISHFQDSKMIGFLDALVRSNREVIVSGLNLDSYNRPYGIMPGVMALADEIILTKAICYYPGCRGEANRSVRSWSDSEPYSPACK